MKKSIKTIIALLLAMCLAITTFTVAFAEENGDVQNNPSTEYSEAESESEIPEEPDEPETPADPERIVATMYICATANSFTGHVWLYFTNLTDEELPLGHVTLAPRDSMSVGSLRNTRKDGGGIYYNGEAFMARNDPDKKCRHTTSLQMDITYAQLEKINQKLDDKKILNTYNFIFWNCGSFAANVWNTVADKKVVHVVLPVITILNMNILGAQKGVVKMNCDDVSKVFKHDKDGAHPVNPASFNLNCI